MWPQDVQLPGEYRYNQTVIDVFYALPFHGQFGVMVERATCVQHDMEVEDVHRDEKRLEEEIRGKSKESLGTAA